MTLRRELSPPSAAGRGFGRAPFLRAPQRRRSTSKTPIDQSVAAVSLQHSRPAELFLASPQRPSGDPCGGTRLTVSAVRFTAKRQAPCSLLLLLVAAPKSSCPSSLSALSWPLYLAARQFLLLPPSCLRYQNLFPQPAASPTHQDRRDDRGRSQKNARPQLPSGLDTPPRTAPETSQSPRPDSNPPLQLPRRADGHRRRAGCLRRRKAHKDNPPPPPVHPASPS